MVVALPFKLQEVYEVATSRSANKDAKLRERFGGDISTDTGNLPLVHKPCVYVDTDGILAEWYLPFTFSPQLSVGRVRFLDATLPTKC